jgi:hypothetical protein
MPPHCDSLDGPVVTTARQALQHGDVDLILPFVHVEGEPEVRRALDLAVKVRCPRTGGGRGGRPVALRDRRSRAPSR